ncbi:putative monocarboxylate transporter mch1, partial [Mortierella sp. NVP85]
MLASGSLYVYTLYAPFFTGRLGYSQTQTSLIAVIGDLGLYGAGPVNGFLADHFGPRATSLYAAFLIASGYSLLSFTYANGVTRVEQGLPPPSFLLMSFSFLLAGVGSSASYMAAFTSLAKNFKQGRGLALGIPISFFGLSAAVLTLIAQSFFMVNVDQLFGEERRELDTKGFLLFLGIFGGCANLFSVVGLKILPSPEVSPEARVESNHAHAAPPPRVQDEQTPLLRDDVAGTPAQGRHTRTPPSVSGKAFFMDTNAQFFFLVTFCLAGTGLMIINSISAIVDVVAAAKSLFLPVGLAGSLGEPNPVSSTRAIHVALISISSYTGRVLSGLGSDVAIHRYGAYRTD